MATSKTRICHNCGSIIDISYNHNVPLKLQKRYLNKSKIFKIEYTKEEGYKTVFYNPSQEVYFCDQCINLYPKLLENIKSINEDKKIKTHIPYKDSELTAIIKYFEDRIINKGGFFKDFKMNMVLLSALQMARWESIDANKTYKDYIDPEQQSSYSAFNKDE